MPTRLTLLAILGALAAASVGASLAGAAPRSGASTAVWRVSGYRVTLHLGSTRAPAFAPAVVGVARAGAPVRHARVRLTVTMLGMAMPGMTQGLHEARPGRYAARGVAFGMAGRFALAVSVAPTHAAPFSVRIVEQIP